MWLNTLPFASTQQQTSEVYMVAQELQRMKVSIEVEIPTELYEALTHFLEARKDWDSDRLASAAIALFLVQDGGSTLGTGIYRNAARVYLDSLFKERV